MLPTMSIDAARVLRRLRLPAPPAGAGLESWAVGAVFCLYCWLLAPDTSDLAAAVFRSDLFGDHGALIYNAQWYSGHHLPGYSLLSPTLGALLGTRLFAALCTLGAIVAFERIAVPRYGLAGRLGAVLFAIPAGSGLLIGRVAFAAGLLFGPLAVLLAIRARWTLAVLAATGCALGSPLAGLFMAMLAGTWFLVARRPWGLAIAAAAVIPSLVLQVAFPEGGTFPYGWPSFLQLAVFAALFLLALPREEVLFRAAAGAYLALGLYAQLVPSQLRGNVYRLVTIVGAPSVAWPAGAAAFAGRSEADFLIQSPPSYLHEMWRNAHWTLYSVDRPVPLLSGPGRLLSATPDSFTFRADRPGRFVMRLHFSRYWAVTTGRGCVRS